MNKFCARLLGVVLIWHSVSIGQDSSNEPVTDELPYPHGADALPLLHEIWNISLEKIYPETLTEKFSPETLQQLECKLITEEGKALADVINPFLTSLGVSHTQFYDRRHQSYYYLRSLFSTRNLDEPQLYTIGVQLSDEDPGLILNVLEHSQAEVVGLRRGDRITEVNGISFESLLQWQQAEPVTLIISREEQLRRVLITPVFQSLHRALATATTASQREIECGTRQIGYIHLWSGTHSEYLESLKQAVANANELKLDGFILDLRDGYGGAWWPYLDPFFPDRSSYFSFTTLNHEGESDPVTVQPQPNVEAWQGPLVVIINSGTRSGKEALAFQFKNSGRATLVGTTTSGAFTGGQGVFAERDTDYILYLSVNEMRLEGIAIEGVGVSPDIIVSDEEIRDVPLETALEILACDSSN